MKVDQIIGLEALPKASQPKWHRGKPNFPSLITGDVPPGENIHPMTTSLQAPPKFLGHTSHTAPDRWRFRNDQ
jgi:hypothetical protein